MQEAGGARLGTRAQMRQQVAAPADIQEALARRHAGRASRLVLDRGALAGSAMSVSASTIAVRR